MLIGNLDRSKSTSPVRRPRSYGENSLLAQVHRKLRDGFPSCPFPLLLNDNANFPLTDYSPSCASFFDLTEPLSRPKVLHVRPPFERPARRDGERLPGKIAFPELPNEIDDRRLANPTPCGIRKNKDQPFRSHNAESRTEHPAFAKQSSLVDETGIEPATSSLRTGNH